MTFLQSPQKTCTHCHALIDEWKRADARFCSETCRKNYWDAKHRKKKKSSLRYFIEAKGVGTNEEVTR